VERRASRGKEGPDALGSPNIANAFVLEKQLLFWWGGTYRGSGGAWAGIRFGNGPISMELITMGALDRRDGEIND